MIIITNIITNNNTDNNNNDNNNNNNNNLATLPRALTDIKSIGTLGSVTKGFDRWID